MIFILAEEGTEAAGQAVASALNREYGCTCTLEAMAAGTAWNREVEWDDLLLIIYNSGALPETAVKFIQTYIDLHKTDGGIIPVSTNPAFKKPPQPIAGIKAAEYDGKPAALEQIVRAAGVFLGLALRPRRQRIFVSYRASDGAKLAQALYDRLESEGFHPWLDVALENVAIGDDVQKQIAENVDGAAMILLVDTPDAPQSEWVWTEIQMANAQLIPVLPVVTAGETRSRFAPLQSLGRQALVRHDLAESTLSDEDWMAVCRELKEVILSAYQRRLRILSRAQTIFEKLGYKWQVVDQHLRMYLADKQKVSLPRVVVFSHCSVHDITYVPALKAYWNFLKKYTDLANLNQKLFIYDRERVLSEPEMAYLMSEIPDMNVILAHHNELELLVATNFTVLRK